MVRQRQQRCYRCVTIIAVHRDLGQNRRRVWSRRYLPTDVVAVSFFFPRPSEKPRLAANRRQELPRTATWPREIFGENRWLHAPGAVEEYRKRSSVIKYKTSESIVLDAIRQYCVQNARPPRAKNVITTVLKIKKEQL